jgi:LAO/AO transport system kinase
MNKTIKPEWQPENAGKEFASYVMPGVEINQEEKKIVKPKKIKLEVDDYINGVLSQNLTILSKTITLIESNSDEHIKKAQEVLKRLLPHTGKSIRIGITGSPGAGKSTFIESFGTYLCKQGLKVAVLAIDPSSIITKGSILGDKTRMEKLSREPNAFIRPSPSGGALGGVTRKTRETILVCEAAGYHVILIETVGVGQSEVTVRSMVDFFMLLLIPGSGDELQGIKKGVVELADLLVINKADGNYIERANVTRHQYSMALNMLQPATEGWKTTALTASALTGKGIPEIWTEINRFVDVTKRLGVFDKRRKSQTLEWIYSIIEEELRKRFFEHPDIAKSLAKVEKDVLEGNLTPTSAVRYLLDLFFK